MYVQGQPPAGLIGEKLIRLKLIYNLDSLKEKAVLMKFNFIKDIKIKEGKLVLNLGF